MKEKTLKANNLTNNIIGLQQNLKSSGSSPDQETAGASMDKCYFKTRSDRLKQYYMSLSETHLVFSRPKSTKQSQFNYSLRSF